jgi:hypothetical protein
MMLKTGDSKTMHVEVELKGRVVHGLATYWVCRLKCMMLKMGDSKTMHVEVELK